jgi:hypothetical protein
MILSFLIDDTTEGVTLLSWPKTEEDDDVQVDGLNIKSKDSGSIWWYKETTQPIPRQLMTFNYSSTIINMTQFGNDFVGLSGDKPLTYGLTDGKIRDDGTLITTFKGLTVKDTLQFTLRRIILDSHTFNLVKIHVNKEECASEFVVEGQDVFPSVLIKSPGVEMNTTFSLGETQGKEGMFIYFFNN